MRETVFHYQSNRGRTAFLILAAIAVLHGAPVTAPAWQKMPGKAVWIAAAADGTVIASTGLSLLSWTGSAWQPGPDTKPVLTAAELAGTSPSRETLRPYAYKSGSMWLLRAVPGPASPAGAIYQMQTAGWKQLPGAAQSLSMVDGATLYAEVGGFLYNYCLCAPSGQTATNKWTLVAVNVGAGQSLGATSVSKAMAWTIGADDQILYYSKSISNPMTWTSSGFANVSDVASGPDGTAVAVTNGSIVQWTGSAWTPMTGAPTGVQQVSVARSNFIWAVTAAGDIYSYQ